VLTTGRPPPVRHAQKHARKNHSYLLIFRKPRSSRTARVSGVTRNLKEAEGKLPTRRTEIAYEASARWARGRIDLKPHVIRIGPAYMRRVRGRKITRLTLRELPFCLPARTVGRRPDVAADVSRGLSSRSASSGCHPT
jgi:hypothetical protein